MPPPPSSGHRHHGHGHGHHGPSSSSSAPTSSSSGGGSKPKPADVAADAKKIYIPGIRDMNVYPLYSHLFQVPLSLTFPPQGGNSVVPPSFYVQIGDPVDNALAWQTSETERTETRTRIPFICGAHEKKPGGEWETAGGGYEERLCRRSNLSAVLSTPAEDQELPNYPIPMEGGILCDTVVVFRGPHPTYPILPTLSDLPIISVHPMPRPKLSPSGTKYSFTAEREITRNKLRAGLRIVLWQGYTSVVIGDFGLGSYRNPPQELAELWRDVFLYDPDLRGKFHHAAFVFDDAAQSTARLIAEDIAKKGGSGSSGKGKSSSSSGSGGSESKKGGSSGSRSGGGYATDFEIFSRVFADEEIQRVLSTPDTRFGLGMITS